MSASVTCPTCGKPLGAGELLRHLLVGAVGVWLARVIVARIFRHSPIDAAREDVRQARASVEHAAGEIVRQETARQQATREVREQLRRRRVETDAEMSHRKGAGYQ